LPSRLAQLVLDVADNAGSDRFVFMGHSWGASIGVQLGVRHPDRVDGLVLLDAGHTDVTFEGSRDELVQQYEADQGQFAFDSWDAFFAWVRENVRDWRPALEPRYREGMTERDGKIVPRASARAAAWALYGVRIEPPSSAHASLRVPVLLVVASDNEDHEALERFRIALPQATVHVVDSGHDVVEDAPEATVRLVAGWLG
jgi:pimeloyl-ACP methyl ester carboxylesterase